MLLWPSNDQNRIGIPRNKYSLVSVHFDIKILWYQISRYQFSYLKSKNAEHNDTCKNRRATVYNRDKNGVFFAVVVSRIVTCHGNETTKRQTQWVKDLTRSIQPDFSMSKTFKLWRKKTVKSWTKSHNNNNLFRIPTYNVRPVGNKIFLVVVVQVSGLSL